MDYEVSVKLLIAISEPVGLKSPTFATDNKLAWFVRHVDQGFALLCPAQGFPVPLSR